MVLHKKQVESMKISKSDIQKVKTLRATLGKDGKPMPLKKINKLTKLSVRRIKFILYERGNHRVKELVAYRMQEIRAKSITVEDKSITKLR
jgi:hypothetical protein